MRLWWLVASATLLLLSLTPAGLEAQARGRRCNQVLPADARQIVNAQGQEVVYFRDPVRMVCTGDLVIEADSAVFNRGEGAIQLVGSVVYRDSTRQLTAEWANYLGRMDELYARGDVILQDLADGSRVTGDELEFRRQTPARPQSLMIVRGRRPHAVLPPSAREGAAAPDTAGPVEVWADRLQFIGETVFLAQGNAEIARGDLRGAADTARFDQGAERMTLVGRSHVENDQYRLEGNRIDALLPGDTLREVHAEGDARLVSEELRVRSQRLRIELEAGALERLEAWNPDGIAAYRPPPAPPPADSEAVALAELPDTMAPAPPAVDTAAAPAEPDPAPDAPLVAAGEEGGAPVAVGEPTDSVEGEPTDSAATRIARAVAEAEDFTLRADSIDARADSGRIREVRAVSRAFGEREPDSLAAGLPGLVARDWIQGDTIVGYFATDTVAGPEAGEPVATEGAAEPEPADSARVVLERIVVIGGSQPALSLYRLQPEREARRGAINFMRAKTITLHMTAGELDRVEADGPIEGLYLDPAQPPAETAPSREETAPPAEETGG